MTPGTDEEICRLLDEQITDLLSGKGHPDAVVAAFDGTMRNLLRKYRPERYEADDMTWAEPAVEALAQRSCRLPQPLQIRVHLGLDWLSTMDEFESEE